MTGIVYDHGAFIGHKCLWDENYSENPLRYTSIVDRCNSLGLIERCVRIETRPATREELLCVHTAKHIDRLKETENYSEQDLEQLSSEYDSIYLHQSTYRQSLMAAGSSIELVKSVVEGKVQNGMAIVRPPGHHAMQSEYCGYCFFNNVAVAAQYVLDKTPIQKILIVDWDVHHGQGTQQKFYNDHRVMYFSIHRYERGQFWPNLRESDSDHTGAGNGRGYNINVPLNRIGMANEDYMAVVHYLLMPVAYEFAPELVIVSSGYDSAIGDPKGQMSVTPVCYAHMMENLKALAGGKVVAILEGGYYYKSLAESAALTLRALLGDACPVLKLTRSPCKSVMETIGDAVYAHRAHWKCFDQSPFTDRGRSSVDLRYTYKEVKPDLFATRNMYPPIDTALFDRVLTNLIEETRLCAPSTRLAVCVSVENQNRTSANRTYSCLTKQVADCYVIENANLASNEELDAIKETDDRLETLENYRGVIGGLFKTLDTMYQCDVRSAIFVPIHTDTSLPISISAIGAKWVGKKYNTKRIMIVEWNDNQFRRTRNDSNAPLHVTVHKSSSANSISISKHDVKIGWPKEIINETELTALVHYVILPIAYEYNPELVIMAVNFGSNESDINITPVMYSHLVNWFSVLADGRLVLLEYVGGQLNSNSRMECLMKCAKALDGKPLDKLCTDRPLGRKAVEIIKFLLNNGKENWKCIMHN
ncbi:polyamine deacetylase HDAC10-like [Adelges cooleyi]|uniref:polyamine deacetylase HDAC10-like n=1 Tax=Adelges cooleyi TaxID=133065 RepID=UPI00217F2AF3|nr:polyamine deacetylase HDAC10-like [Adelges cooleyi]